MAETNKKTSKTPPIKKRASTKKTAIARSKKPELKAVDSTPEAQVMTALVKQIESGKLKADELSLVLDAQERVLDRQAKQSFNIAMIKCQTEMPRILKTEYNDQTKSNYESLEALNKLIQPVYAGNGFAISFGTTDGAPEDFTRVTAEVMHRDGWSKTYEYDMPLDMAGIKGTVNKTKVHASGSSMSYARRYLLKMIFNLITTDDVDDDGNAAGNVEELNEVISLDQVIVLDDLITETKSNKDKFLKHCKITALEALPANKYDHAVKILEQKKGTNK